jgi:hypothetical protein
MTAPKKFLSLVVIAMFLLSPLFLATNASASSSIQPRAGIIVSKDDVTAGYQFIASNPGSKTIYVQTIWKVPSVTCTTDSQILYFFVTISHAQYSYVGSELTIVCLAAIGGPFPSYSIAYWLGFNSNSIDEPLRAGDSMKTIASIGISTGAASTTIEDITQGWTNMTSGNVGTSASSGIVNLYMYGNKATSTNPLADFSTVKFASIKIALKGHTGTPGSFLSLKGVAVKEYILINPSNKNILVKPSTITASATNISLKWLNGN